MQVSSQETMGAMRVTARVQPDHFSAATRSVQRAAARQSIALYAAVDSLIASLICLAAASADKLIGRSADAENPGACQRVTSSLFFASDNCCDAPGIQLRTKEISPHLAL